MFDFHGTDMDFQSDSYENRGVGPRALTSSCDRFKKTLLGPLRNAHLNFEWEKRCQTEKQKILLDQQSLSFCN